ncbi:hypothetical protein ABMA27_003821 [Loxostege sticticalis]|uniref:RNase H type-1 domain-containing protein n=1 Tax=Loxostege sticticalis TaxID=481309 RepID=A0ABR3HQH2_LOXSC
MGSWARKNKPILIITHQYLRSVQVHRSLNLEIFTYDFWLSSIDLTQVIYHKINKISESKTLYHKHVLKNICLEYIDTEYLNFYKVFSDGSKEKDQAGAAFYDPQQDTYMTFKIQSKISIMYLELLAISEALSYISSIRHDKFVILTDSKSGLQHIARCTSTVRGTPIAYTIINQLLELRQNSKLIKLQWIPAHVGISDNERVDYLAKRPYYSDCLHLVKEFCYQLWKEYFDLRSREKGIWYKTIQPKPLMIPWIDNCLLNRKYIVTAMRLRSGHIPSRKFKFLMGLSPTPFCEDCGILDDVYHVLVECVRNEQFRRQIFHCNLSEIGRCNSILAEPMSDKAVALYKLFKLAFD